MLYLAQLKIQARKILEIPESIEGFISVSFKAQEVLNEAKIPSIYEAEDDEYNTTEIVVLCSDTGTVDLHGDSIFVTPTNQVFVGLRSEGTVRSLETLRLTDPVL